MALHEHPLAHQLCSAVLAETQDTIVSAIRALRRETMQATPHLLDVGCWEGESTARYGEPLGATLAGIEVFPVPAATARARGVDVAAIDLELQPFPWESGSFDVAVANQVFEHLKNIWLPLTEIHRCLRPGGYFVISVPNLASLHNRILLAIGRQPTSIRTLGVHVRGYTVSEMLGLITLGGAFEVTAVKGVGFYPLSARLARPLAAAWAGGSHTMVVVARKTDDRRTSPWQEYRQQEIDAGAQTFYS